MKTRSSDQCGGGMEPIPSIAMSPAAAECLADRLSPEKLYRIIEAVPELQRECLRGFQASRKSTRSPVVRKRLIQALNRHPEFAALFLYGGGPWMRMSDALEAFDETWLVRWWRELVRDAETPVVLLAAMVLDSRNAVHRRGALALRLYRGDTGAAREPRAEAPEIRSTVAEIVVGADLGARGKKEVETPPPSETVSRLERRVSELEERVDRLRKEREKAHKDLKAARDHHAREIRDREKRIRELRAKVRQLEAEKTELLQAAEKAARAAVEAEHRRIIEMSAVRPEIASEAERAGPTVEVLLERTEKVLGMHRELNRSYAACSTIREHIAALEDALERISVCGRESVVVLPVLHEVKDEIEQHIRRLRALLPEFGKQAEMANTDLVRQMLRDIDAASSDEHGMERIRQWEHLLEQKLFRRLLGDRQVRTLRRKLAERNARIEQVLRARAMAPAEASEAQAGMELNSRRADAPTPATASQVLHPRLELQRLRKSHRTLSLVVDGYNVTKGIPDLAQVEEVHGLGVARQRLVDLCHRALPEENVEIVFDGSDALGTLETWGNVRVRFAGKRHESHNADDRIVQLLRDLSGKKDDDGGGSAAIWLVTADYALRRRSAPFCDGWVDPGDFYGLLKES